MDSSHNFLHKKLPDLQKAKEVQDAVDKQARLSGEKVPNSPDARLSAYMDRLEKIFLHEDERTRTRNIAMLRDKIHNAMIIKREDVPESYFDLQKRVARERGQPVEDLSEDMKEQMKDVIIEDQKKSLDSWIDYLTSDDAMYPTWFKYFVFRNITKLSQFDKELGKFKERTSSTTSPFPDIYREALAYVADLYESASKDKALFQDKDFQVFLSKKFPTQYANAIQKTLEYSQEDKEQIKGEWIKYEQGDDNAAKKLYASLQSKGTGWCTVGSSTAQAQIDSGDFYVYYTYDKDNNPTKPRLAIRMNGKDSIGEVRGVLLHQEVEPLLQEVLDAKLHDFGSKADTYKKKSSDMKHLTAIEKATQENKQLTEDDLRFLYELDSPIEGFGYEEDPRIEEIRSRRNRHSDILTLCNCPPEAITSDFLDVTESTQVFCEDNGKKITLFDFREPKNQVKLPQLLEFAKSIKASGSPARPDMSFGGIVDCAVTEEQAKDRATLTRSFKEADNTSPSYMWDKWNEAPLTKPQSLSFETIVLSYNNDSNIRRSLDQIVKDMDKLGLRPLTLEEMMIAGISYPTFTKTDSRYFVGLTQYALDGVSYVPNLCRYDGDRRLLRDWWGIEWGDVDRFLCVRK